MSLFCISIEKKTKEVVFMERKFSLQYVDISPDVPKGEIYFQKQEFRIFGGFLSAYVCGGHKNNLRL